MKYMIVKAKKTVACGVLTLSPGEKGEAEEEVAIALETAGIVDIIGDVAVEAAKYSVGEGGVTAIEEGEWKEEKEREPDAAMEGSEDVVDFGRLKLAVPKTNKKGK